jgi:peptide-methionine (S)-S-oxide reductase
MPKSEKAVLGAGCFWCTEAIFQRINGVTSVFPGYAGGTRPNPTYEEICTGRTGHAEVAEITFDAEHVSYEKILDIFWESHDPTTLNRQGADVGTQYRSAIFCASDMQRVQAEKSKTRAQEMFRNPIVTTIELLTQFYPAEDYHQKYYDKNPNAPYCRIVIKPKIDKMSGKQRNGSESRL